MKQKKAADKGAPKAEGAGPAKSPGGAATGLGNMAMQRRAGGGEPLSPGLRRQAEASLGVPLSAVRLHRDAGAQRAAASQGARGYAVGQDVVLGADAGPHTLGHELVHVAQAARNGAVSAPSPVDRPGSRAEAEARTLGPRVFSGAPLPVRARTDARVHRDSEKPAPAAKTQPDTVITPLGGDGALSAYPGLKASLEPGDWDALSAAARRRGETIAAGGAAPPAENEAVADQVTTPLQRLFRPPTEAGSIETGQAYMQDIYTLGMAQAGPAAMGARLQREILGRWLETESGILTEPVTIALADPAGKAGGQGVFLTFALRGQLVESRDGTLIAAAVDRALNNSLEGIVSSVQGEMSGLEMAINKSGQAAGTLSAAREVVAKSDTEISLSLLDQAEAALRQRAADLGRINEQPFAGFVADNLNQTKSFLDGDLVQRRATHMAWRAQNPRHKSSYERQVNDLDDSMNAMEDAQKKGGWDGFWESYGAAQSIEAESESVGTTNMFTGGAAEQERQLGEAYDQGQISFSQFEEAADAASTRGWIFFGITAALTVATLGLGLYLAPATLGAEVVFGVTAGVVTTTAPMLASNAYTSVHDLSDPTMQTWWKDSSYSAGDIATAGVTGGVLGGAFPLAGRLIGALGRMGAAPILAGELPAAEGVVARTVGKGVVELSIPAEGVTVHVTEQGWTMYGPAGANANAPLSSGTWAEMGAEPLTPGSRLDFMHGDYPTSLAMGDRGWGMVSPNSASPVQFGLWPEAALPPGGASMAPEAGGMAPIVLDGNGGQIIPAGGSMGAPPGPQATPGPYSYALPQGPQPFGLLYPKPPQFDWVGPNMPAGFNAPDQFGQLIQTTGTGVLPPTGEGGGWQRLDSGLYVPVYYGDNPQAMLKVYGQGLDVNFLYQGRGGNVGGLVQPNETALRGGRGYPMQPSDMTLSTGEVGARSHLGPHGDTKPAGPGQTSSTSDRDNYAAHPRRYNTWIRRTLEGRLRTAGTPYTIFEEAGATPKLTSGGFLVPEAEDIVQFDANWTPIKAWRFPFTNFSLYDSLSGDIDTVLGQFEIAPSSAPKGRIIR